MCFLQDAVDRGWLRHKRSCKDGPLNLAAVLATVCEIASGLAALHGQGVVHGDLSAFNIMLSRYVVRFLWVGGGR
jgi:tRNA A-37 threonylcarbamoyl transferase component Bud32